MGGSLSKDEGGSGAGRTRLEVSREAAARGIHLAVGRRYLLVVPGKRGVLSARLFDASGEAVLAGLPYEVAGPDGERYQGTTDGQGGLFHDRVKRVTHTVRVKHPGSGQSFQADLPWLERRDPPHPQHVRGFKLAKASPGG